MKEFGKLQNNKNNMQDEQILYPNDTTRKIEKMIAHLREWRAYNKKANERETELVITKLEEAKHWSYFMVNHEELEYTPGKSFSPPMPGGVVE